MNRKTIILSLLLLTGLCAFAGPAKLGDITFTQPNGYKFIGTLKGDEFGHVLTTKEGCALIQDKDGYYSYAYFDSQGHRFSSGVHVGEKAPSDVVLCSKQIPWTEVSALAMERKRLAVGTKEGESVLKRMLGGRTVRIGGSAKKTEGANGTVTRSGAKLTDDGDAGTMVKHGLIILAQYDDSIKFKYGKSDFEAMLMQDGYSVNGATGSVVEYFNASFNGLCDFQFTVSEIVTLPHEREYYGGNDDSGNDQRPAEMIVDACTLADAEIDFSLFDDDGDGVVDNVFVFYAGGDEAAGFGDDCIWSHSWYLDSGAGITDLVLDGVKIDRYACTAELRKVTEDGVSKELMTGIGTFCHEYTHTFGLMDLYDTDYDNPSGSMVAAGLWRRTSLMDAGNYNNNGNTPPYFNAVERDGLGLWEPETLEVGTYVLEPINENGRYLKMETDTEGEYFLFECRSNNGWDAYINNGEPAAGLLVYHIDKSTETKIYSPTYGYETTPAQRWSIYYNEVNANPDHQCADLIEADGRSDAVTSTALSSADLAGLFFPTGKTDFTPDTEPAFTTWGSRSSDLSLTDIHMEGDNVVFTVISSSDIAVPYAVNITVVPFQDAAIIDWESDYSSTRTAYITIDDEAEAHEISPYSTGHYAYVADHLSPNTQYTAKIWYDNFDGTQGEVVTYRFTTKSVSSTTNYPYIYFITPANEDGSFYRGTKVPLRVYNAVNATEVTWQLGSFSIEVGADGYYELTATGTLKATITYDDGTKEIITRRFLLTDPPAEEE